MPRWAQRFPFFFTFLTLTVKEPRAGAGTTNPDNAKANIAIAEKGPLPPATLEKIRAAFKRAEQASGTTWTGQQ